MKSVSFFFRTLLLALFTLSLLAGAIVSDYYFRHEVTRKARRYLASRGIEVASSSALPLAVKGDLKALEQLEIAGFSLGVGDTTGMTPLLAAVKAKNGVLIDFLLERRTVTTLIDRQTEPEHETALSVTLNRRDFKLADRLIAKGATPKVESEPGVALIVASVRSGDKEMVDYLLSKGASPDFQASETVGALAIAADQKDLAMMEKLLDAKADPNAIGVSGKNLLSEAVIAGRKDQFDLLLTHQPDVNAASGNHESGGHMTALSYAVDQRDVPMQEALLKAGASPEAMSVGGDPLLWEAVEKMDFELTRRLLSHGAKCDVVSSKKRSPLLSAVWLESPDFVDLLLGSGADPSFSGAKGETPLSVAVSLGNLAIVNQLLVTKKVVFDGPAMLAESYQRRDDPLMRVLLQSGVDPESLFPKRKERIFDVAVKEGATGAVRTLLGAGAKIGDNLWAALLTGQDDLIRLILAAGGDPRQIGPDGQDPLDYCLTNERYAAARELLTGGANPDARFDESETWLAKSLREGNSDIATELIKAGATVKGVRAGDGHTLLGWAIANKMRDATIALLKAGVDPDEEERVPAAQGFRDRFESTTFRYHLQVDGRIRPIMLAAAQRDQGIAQALMDAGAKRNSYSRKYLSGAIIGSWYKDVKMQQICLLGRAPEVQPRKVIVSLSRQTVTLYENGVATFSTPCSTGMRGYGTPPGEYVISDQNRHHVSTIYHASMPFFQRFSFSAFGLHQGVLPGYPASHGCIRLSYSGAQHLFGKLRVGDYAAIVP